MKLKTLAEELGLTEGQEIELVHTSGPHNGESFCGELACDIEIGKPVFIEGHEDVTSDIREITHELGHEYSLVAQNGNTYTLTKKVSTSVPREKSVTVI
jgi:hypothetical protein